MKIYTKTGDKGETSLIGGKRVQKNNERIEAYGTIDELNSIIGMIRNFDLDEYDIKIFSFIQNKLFDVGSCLAVDKNGAKYKIPELNTINEKDINILEEEIDKISSCLPVPKGFIIPAGSFLISWCNIARTVCRRAERKMISIKDLDDKYHNCMIFVNRLSDFLFIIGRKYAKDNNVEEIFWNNEE